MREGEGGGGGGGGGGVGKPTLSELSESVTVYYIHDLVHTCQCCDVIFNGGTE